MRTGNEYLEIKGPVKVIKRIVYFYLYICPLKFALDHLLGDLNSICGT
jgi:hypothetical protein